MRLYDPDLDARIRQIEGQMAPLTGMAGEVAPPPGLFNRILDAIAGHEARSAVTKRLPFAEGRWEPYSDGIAMKYLWDSDTFLLRCEPGSVIPPHEHELTEHLIVVSGDLLINGLEFDVGDYHTMQIGTRHEDASTRSGCILFVQLRP